MGRLGVVDQSLDRRLVTNVDTDARSADLSCYSLGLGDMQVGHDDMTSTRFVGGSASASPIPEPPPVMTTTRSWSSMSETVTVRVSWRREL